MRKFLIAAALAFVLTGCTSTTGMIEPEHLYPKVLTTCADSPSVPARPAPGQARPDTDKAKYLKALRGAWADCHDTVDGWAELRHKYVQQYEHQNYGYFERVWRAVTDKSADD
jgi:hypothetical protein